MGQWVDSGTRVSGFWVLTGRKAFPVFCRCSARSCFQFFCGSLFFLGRLPQWRRWINREVSVVGLFLSYVVSGLNLRIAVGQNVGKSFDDKLNLVACELGTNPNDKPGYSICRH